MRKKKITKLILEIALLLFMLVWIYPFFNIFLNSFKSTRDMMKFYFSLPTEWRFENYKLSWESLELGRAFINTVYVTALAVAGQILFGSMAAYKLARTDRRISRICYMVFLIPMVMPFQTIMYTLTRVAKILNLLNSATGLSVIYWGTGLPFVIFLYHGFIKTVPLELEECAKIDGASSFQIFFKIVFPLIKPVTITNVVINVMAIWNDFFLPMLMLGSAKGDRTLQLALYTNFGTTGFNWELALPAIVIAALPSIFFFILMQKHIVKGIVAGAVKG